MSMSRLQRIITKYRRDLAAHQYQAEQELIRAYYAILAQIQPKLDRLYAEIQEKIDRGEEIPASWLYESNRLNALKQYIQAQFNHYGELAGMIAARVQAQAVALGVTAGGELLQATVPVGYSWSFGLPSPAAIRDLIGATQAGSPLADLFRGFGVEAARKAGEALITGLGLGYNPLKVAPLVEQALHIPQSRARTICRTEQLRAYRSANLETFKANNDVCDGWIWISALTRNTCFPKGTLVQTKRGNVPIEQVRIGDEVLTHKGRYRRVYDTLQRPYTGEMVTLTSDERSVVATSNHPFLIEREGKLNWIEAGDLRLTDHVVRQFKGCSQVHNHSLINSAVKRGIRQSNDTITSRLKPKGLSLIPPFDTWLRMPVQAIDLKASIERGQKKIDWITPTRERMFLPVCDAQLLKAETRPSFGFRFPCELAITPNGAEEPVSLFYRTNTKFLSTLFTCLNNCRASTRFRAVFAGHAVWIKQFAATLTGNISHLRVSADFRTMYDGISTWHDCECLAASQADFCNVGVDLSTFQATKVLLSTMRQLKRFSTVLADPLNIRKRDLPSCSVRMDALISGIASLRAKPSIAFFYPGLRNLKYASTLLTRTIDSAVKALAHCLFFAHRRAIDPFFSTSADINPDFSLTESTNTLNVSPVAFDIQSFHTSSISQRRTHIQPYTTVYNIEVEEDHSYVANGFVVHNCAACIAMHGTFHRLDEEMPAHVCCRCVKMPTTKSWKAILAPHGIDTSRIPDTRPVVPLGPDWFDSQDEETQRAILGPKYEGWSRGDFTLRDMVGRRSDADWGKSIYVKSLKTLTGASR